MKSKISQGKLTGSLVAVALFAALAPAAHATTDTATSELTQSIAAGVLITDFRDASNVIVGSPSFAMSTATVSTEQQTITGTFGSNAQRISVDNPGGANGGWTLTIAASNVADLWTSGGNTYDFNGSAANGQLTLNPAVATLTSRVGTSTNVSLGTSTAFNSGVVDAVTLLTAGSGADDVWNGYLTGVGVSQTIPAAKPVGSYSLNLVQTATSV